MLFCSLALLAALAPCPDDASLMCGTHQVGLGDGKTTITLHLTVAKATGRDPAAEPLFVLAGGPGQAATEVGPMLLPAFRYIRRRRDIVFVDQRGTGKSARLPCKMQGDTLADLVQNELDPERIKTCRENLPFDPRYFTTPYAADDIDAVRQHLGYKEIHLFGASYGTRLALVYARRHKDHLRSMVLDGVAPFAIKLPLHMGEDASAARDNIEADYGDLDLASVWHSLPRDVVVRDPHTAERQTLHLTKDAAMSILRAALYSSALVPILPLVVEEARRANFEPLLALASLQQGGDVSLGLYLSVVCAEDIPSITEDEKNALQDGPWFGKAAVDRLQKACAIWSVPPMNARYYDAVKSDTRSLLLSGKDDPATPPRWAKEAAKTLTNATLVTVPNIAHGTWHSGCVAKEIANFVDDKVADFSCAQKQKRLPPFRSMTGAR